MAWMVDFASRMFDLYPESENPLAEPAVVLIDEIDLHLHPKWQRELLDYLSNLFPNTQFIVTTHSPLIVQSAVARDANIVVCRREGDHVVIDQSIEAVRELASRPDFDERSFRSGKQRDRGKSNRFWKNAKRFC